MATGTYRRPLGENQRYILKTLVSLGPYWKGCSWVWVCHSNTKKILDSLVGRGLVNVDKGMWSISDAGARAVAIPSEQHIA